MKKYSFLLLLTIMAFWSSVVKANSLSAVDTDSCHEMINTELPFVLILKTDQELIPSIINCIDSAKIASASLSGLGAVKNPELAYFYMDKKKYGYKTFSGTYELASLNGNITTLQGKHFAHMHVTLGDKYYHAISGHLNSATVGATAEITIIPLKNIINRKEIRETGLKVIFPKDNKINDKN